MCDCWNIYSLDLPGPFAFLSVMRPSLKMTARSYSWTIYNTIRKTITQDQFTFKSARNNDSCSLTDLLSLLTFRQNQIVMGKRHSENMPEIMTMNQPMHPKDPVRSAERETTMCVREIVTYCETPKTNMKWRRKPSCCSKNKNMNKFARGRNKIWFTGV